MESSGYIHPSTSEHLRGRQDPDRPHYESQALPCHVEQEGIVVRGYEWLLELPVAFVLTVMWVAGVALLGLCALTLHLLEDLLPPVLVGEKIMVEPRSETTPD